MGKYMDTFNPDGCLVPEDVYFTNWKNYEMDYHMHSYGGFELNYVTSGECEYYVEKECIKLKKRNLLLINSALPHKLVFTSEEPCLILGMACGALPEKPGYVTLRSLMEAYDDVKMFLQEFDDYVVIKDGHPIFKTLRAISAELSGERNLAYMQMECNKILIDMARMVQNQDHQTAEYVSKAKMYMMYHFYEIESIEDIADYVGVNKIYLQRIFKIYEKETLWNYLMKIRMEKAAMFLTNTDMPIGEIDHMIGMKSRQCFYQNFKKTFQMSPREYQKANKNVKNNNLNT